MSNPETEREPEMPIPETEAGTLMTISAAELARFYNDFMRSEGVQDDALDQGDLPVRTDEEVAQWRAELDHLYDEHGCLVGRPGKNADS
jgi:hypothetical protein